MALVGTIHLMSALTGMARLTPTVTAPRSRGVLQLVGDLLTATDMVGGAPLRITELMVGVAWRRRMFMDSGGTLLTLEQGPHGPTRIPAMSVTAVFTLG